MYSFIAQVFITYLIFFIAGTKSLDSDKEIIEQFAVIYFISIFIIIDGLFLCCFRCCFHCFLGCCGIFQLNEIECQIDSRGPAIFLYLMKYELNRCIGMIVLTFLLIPASFIVSSMCEMEENDLCYVFVAHLGMFLIPCICTGILQQICSN
jgi:hypothetical protein